MIISARSVNTELQILNRFRKNRSRKQQNNKNETKRAGTKQIQDLFCTSSW